MLHIGPIYRVSIICVQVSSAPRSTRNTRSTKSTRSIRSTSTGTATFPLLILQPAVAGRPYHLAQQQQQQEGEVLLGDEQARSRAAATTLVMWIMVTAVEMRVLGRGGLGGRTRVGLPALVYGAGGHQNTVRRALPSTLMRRTSTGVGHRRAEGVLGVRLHQCQLAEGVEGGVMDPLPVGEILGTGHRLLGHVGGTGRMGSTAPQRAGGTAGAGGTTRRSVGEVAVRHLAAVVGGCVGAVLGGGVEGGQDQGRGHGGGLTAGEGGYEAGEG